MKVPTRVKRLTHLLERNTWKSLVKVMLLFLQAQVDHCVVGFSVDYSVCARLLDSNSRTFGNKIDGHIF